MGCEPKMLPSELLRALGQMTAGEVLSADEAGDFNTEARHLMRASVLREATAVVQTHYFKEPRVMGNGGE